MMKSFSYSPFIFLVHNESVTSPQPNETSGWLRLRQRLRLLHEREGFGKVPEPAGAIDSRRLIAQRPFRGPGPVSSASRPAKTWCVVSDIDKRSITLIDHRHLSGLAS
jgi:hypothetical protein